jgi:hypothetical protein
MYSKVLAEDEWLMYWKHVEDIYWNKFKNKVHFVGSYCANEGSCVQCNGRTVSQETAHFM